jgi:hypothetical protein
MRFVLMNSCPAQAFPKHFPNPFWLVLPLHNISNNSCHKDSTIHLLLKACLRDWKALHLLIPYKELHQIEEHKLLLLKVLTDNMPLQLNLIQCYLQIEVVCIRETLRVRVVPHRRKRIPSNNSVPIQ